MNNTNTDDTKKHGGGPKTPEGKRRSSLNATRHGLLSKTVVLATEDEEDFQELLDNYIRDFSPQTSFELDLVHELVVCRWRIERIWSMESTLVEIGMERSRHTLAAQFPGQRAHNLVAAFAFMEMSSGDRSLQLLHRYESRLTKRFHQIYNELRTLAKERARVEQASACDSPRSNRRNNDQNNLPNELSRPRPIHPMDDADRDKTPPFAPLNRPNGRTPPDKYVNRAPKSLQYALRARPVCPCSRVLCCQ